MTTYQGVAKITRDELNRGKNLCRPGHRAHAMGIGPAMGMR